MAAQRPIPILLAYETPAGAARLKAEVIGAVATSRADAMRAYTGRALLAAGLRDGRDVPAAAAAIETYLRDRVAYVVEQDEQVQDPVYTVEVGSGDCDCQAAAAAAMCLAAGMRARARVGDPAGARGLHAWVEAFDPVAGAWEVIDSCRRGAPRGAAPKAQRAALDATVGDLAQTAAKSGGKAVLAYLAAAFGSGYNPPAGVARWRSIAQETDGVRRWIGRALHRALEQVAGEEGFIARPGELETTNYERLWRVLAAWSFGDWRPWQKIDGAARAAGQPLATESARLAMTLAGLEGRKGLPVPVGRQALKGETWRPSALQDIDWKPGGPHPAAWYAALRRVTGPTAILRFEVGKGGKWALVPGAGDLGRSAPPLPAVTDRDEWLKYYWPRWLRAGLRALEQDVLDGLALGEAKDKRPKEITAAGYAASRKPHKAVVKQLGKKNALWVRLATRRVKSAGAVAAESLASAAAAPGASPYLGLAAQVLALATGGQGAGKKVKPTKWVRVPRLPLLLSPDASGGDVLKAAAEFEAQVEADFVEDTKEAAADSGDVRRSLVIGGLGGAVVGGALALL